MKILKRIILICIFIAFTLIIMPSNKVEAANEDITKVLLIGNSYTYYNDYGGILAELAKKKNKKMIVVAAVHGGKDAKYLYNGDLSTISWDNRKDPTKSYLLTGKITDYSDGWKLSKIIARDWGSIDRPNNWDYVILQNHQQDGNTDGNMLIYNMVKDTIPKRENFIILRTYTPRWQSHIGNAMLQDAQNNGFTSIDIKTMAEKYSSSYMEKLTIKDDAKHPSIKGAYFMATACYARIFGRGALAQTTDDTSFIKLYDKGDGTDFYTVVYPKKGKADNYEGDTANAREKAANEAMNLTEKAAKKIQSVIYKNYSNCIVVNKLNGWKQEDSKWYYFNNNVKQIGWINDGTGIYYLNTSTGERTVGQVTIGANVYYFQADGKMLINAIQGNYYYRADGTGILDINAPKIEAKQVAIDTTSVQVNITVTDNETQVSSVTLDGNPINLTNGVYTYFATKNGTNIVAASDIMGNVSSLNVIIDSIKQPEPVPEPVPDPKPDPVPDPEPQIEIQNYKEERKNINGTEKVYLMKIKSNTNTTNFMKNIRNAKKYSINRKEKEIYSNQNTNNNLIVATGDILNLENGTYTIIIEGDLNKDGRSTITDLVQIKRHIVGYKTLDEESKMASDMNYDNKVSITDLVKIKKLIVN